MFLFDVSLVLMMSQVQFLFMRRMQTNKARTQTDTHPLSLSLPLCTTSSPPPLCTLQKILSALLSYICITSQRLLGFCDQFNSLLVTVVR